LTAGFTLSKTRVFERGKADGKILWKNSLLLDVFRRLSKLILDEAVDRNHREIAGERHRLSQLDDRLREVSLDEVERRANYNAIAPLYDRDK
jgi:hypothetical protein